MKKITSLSLGALSLLPAGAFAATTSGTLPKIGFANTNDSLTIESLLTTVVYWILGISGAVAVLFLILGGLQYVTSSGNEEKTSQAKKTLISAVAGLIIIALATAVVVFVASNADKVTNGTLVN